ncbi:hypothetical protein GCM10022291_32920 [Postechiella marina]|uniref:HTH araC/xylS-type domain-containing protein n=1 Tax=Postechiella marina TaxID=943941 RepID=A0ABP8CHU7_9FLAO
MKVKQSNKNSDFSEVMAYINSSNVSHYIHLQDFKINVLIINDNLKLHQDYDKILSPHFNYAFSYNNIDAIEKLNEKKFDLGFDKIIEWLTNQKNLTKNKYTLPTNNIYPFLIITSRDIGYNELTSPNFNKHGYVIKPKNQKKIISKFKLFTNHTTPFQNNQKKQGVFDKVLHHINENLYKEEFNVKTLSCKTGYSQRQLARIIKAETNMTPVKLILELRLKKAYELLSKETNLKIKEIQYSIGINSPSYFSKKFKERYGYSPSYLHN